MKPPAITVDFDSDTPRSSSDFEEISYPSSYNWSAPHNEEELPLHYMSEEKARRRVVRGPGAPGVFGANEGVGHGAYDDEGKDVYSKPRHIQNRLGSGRLPQPLAPPPTTIVRLPNYQPRIAQLTLRRVRSTERIPIAKPRAPPRCHLHTSLLLDAFPQNRQVECGRLGRSALWEVRLALPQARVLL